MGKFILTDVRLFTAGADLTGRSNKVEITSEVEDKDATNYGSQGWKEVLGGLASSDIAGEGQWEAGDPGKVDNVSWAELGAVGPWTIGPDGAAVGDLTYFTRALRADYKLGDAVGEIAPWTGSAKGSWPLVRGVFEHAPGTARTSSGDSAGVELGSVAAGQSLYAALHVLSVSGTSSPTITVEVESDVDGNFSSPATQLSFTAATAAGGQILRTGGSPVADTWYRASWTISGSTPSFMFALALGIR
ncbi:hypothetical protein [Streptomyces marianii]|uniref:Uncharacterized protein n=1 Tax=Streptomyces marianii TaxID=1817406 RepID=A0A5R9ECQ8_9ACTN|nr:hypothetical protein [Streptomyces marianii]TLQ45753.1 hypothetical protein FEF34_24630 [Streptomyces marianii]